jgi:hypothetical protein
MPGFPLNLGTILGGVTQGWNQSQDAALRNAIQRMAMQQQQQQRQAQTLAGLGLQAGLLNTQPMSPITNSPQLPPAQPAPQPPMPGQPSAPTPQQVYNAGGNVDGPPSATSWPPSNMPSQAGTPAPGVPIGTTFPPPPDQDTPRIPTQRLLTAPPNAQPQTAAADEDEASAEAAGGGYFDLSDVIAQQRADAADAAAKRGQTPAPTAPARAPTSSAPPAADNQGSSGSSTGSQGGGSDIIATLPGGQQLPISTLFRSIDTTKIAQRLEQLAPPGTDPAEIYEATADLLKLSDGDKAQQQQSAYMAKLLFGDLQFQQRKTLQDQRLDASAANQQANRDVRVSEGQANRTTRIQAANISAQTRLQIAQLTNDARQNLESFKEDRIDARNTLRLQQTATRLQAAAVAAKDTNLSKQASVIRGQISAVKPQADGSYSPEQQKDLMDYADQLADINQKLAANYGASSPQPQGAQ